MLLRRDETLKLSVTSREMPIYQTMVSMVYKKANVFFKFVLLAISTVASFFASASTELWRPYHAGNATTISILASQNYDEMSCNGTVKRTRSNARSKELYTYEAGVELERQLPTSGEVNFDLLADRKTGNYGFGGGYKSFVRLFKDQNNRLDLGFIRNKKIQRKGYTVMVEGVINGRPVANYWRKGKPHLITGPAHHIRINWGEGQVRFLVDTAEKDTMQYSVNLGSPKFSFLCAARRPGDGVSSHFDNVTFNGVGDPEVQVPAAQPRAIIEATVSFRGAGNGYAAYLNLHDAYSNAVAFGFQADNAERNSKGVPTLHENRVVNGVFTHKYFAATSVSPETAENWKLAYFDQQQIAIFYRNGVPVASINVGFKDRMFFQAEVNGKANGDSINAIFTNVKIGGVWSDGTLVTPNGVWNTTHFNFWGIQATTRSGSVNSAAFDIGGVITGLPAGADWDNIESINNGRYAGQPAGAIAMIAEYWNGL